MNEPICLIAEGLQRWFRMLDLRMMDVGMQDVPPTFKSMSPFFGFPIPLNIQASHICFFSFSVSQLLRSFLFIA